MLKVYGEDLVKDLVIKNLKMPTMYANELFSTILQRDSPETGYEKFHFFGARKLKDPLEQSVIERLKEKLTHVKDYKIHETIYISSREM